MSYPFLAKAKTFLSRFVSGRSDRRIDVCGLKMTEYDICRNTLFTGVIGSGKTVAMHMALNGLMAKAGDHDTAVAGGLLLGCKPGDLLRIDSRGADILAITPGDASVCFNLIDPDVSSREAASDTWELVRSAYCGNSNVLYWDALGKEFLHHCIEALRLTWPTREIVVSDILQVFIRESGLSAVLQDLPRDSRTFEFFHQTWGPMDEKVKGVIRDAVRLSLGAFANDPKLRAQFCSRSSFSFKDCEYQGRLVALTPDHEYPAETPMIGKALLRRFQRMANQRKNQPRPVWAQLPLLVLAMDNAHQFLSEDHDAEWLAVNPELRVACFATMQSNYSLEHRIGERSAAVILNQFRNQIWFNNCDAKTTEFAARVTGMPDRHTFSKLRHFEFIAFVKGSGKWVRRFLPAMPAMHGG